EIVGRFRGGDATGLQICENVRIDVVPAGTDSAIMTATASGKELREPARYLSSHGADGRLTPSAANAPKGSGHEVLPLGPEECTLGRVGGGGEGGAAGGGRGGGGWGEGGEKSKARPRRNRHKYPAP